MEKDPLLPIRALPPITLSSLPEHEEVSLSLTPSEFKDRLIFGHSIDPSIQSSSSSSSSLLEALAFSSSPEFHQQSQQPHQLQKWLIDPNYKCKKTNLHRSKTAPAMAVINDVDHPHVTEPRPTSQSIVRQGVLLLLVYLSLGILIYWFNRHQFLVRETHPVVDALYFCIVTMCAIGYGDITPNSTTTKLFSVLFVLVGFGFIDILLSGMVTHVLDLQENYLLRTVKAGKQGDHAKSVIIDVKKGRMRIRMKVVLALGVVVMCIGIGVGVMHFVERLGWLDSLYLSVMLVTTVGYGDRAFTSLPGRVFASVWLLVSTLAVARAFLYLAEARVDKRNRRLTKWVLGQNLTISQFLAADMDNNGFVRCSSESQHVTVSYPLLRIKDLSTTFMSNQIFFYFPTSAQFDVIDIRKRENTKCRLSCNVLKKPRKSSFPFIGIEKHVSYSTQTAQGFEHQSRLTQTRICCEVMEVL